MAILPMLSDFPPRRIEVSILVYPGFELLDATGPASVFNTANFILGQRAEAPAYGISMVSPTGGIVRSSSGVGVDTRPLSKEPPKNLHTFLVAGAEGGPLANAMKDPVICKRAPRWAESASRYGSICAGTFVLAALQLIDGRRVASHWDACRPLAAAFPKVQVEEDAIFIEDGNVWTSAGVTTGIVSME